MSIDARLAAMETETNRPANLTALSHVVKELGSPGVREALADALLQTLSRGGIETPEYLRRIDDLAGALGLDQGTLRSASDMIAEKRDAEQMIAKRNDADEKMRDARADLRTAEAAVQQARSHLADAERSRDAADEKYRTASQRAKGAATAAARISEIDEELRQMFKRG